METITDKEQVLEFVHSNMYVLTKNFPRRSSDRLVEWYIPSEVQGEKVDTTIPVVSLEVKNKGRPGEDDFFKKYDFLKVVVNSEHFPPKTKAAPKKPAAKADE